MNNSIPFFSALGISVLLMAIQASISQARQSILISQREARPGMVDRALRLLLNQSLPVTLNLASVVMHFMLAVSGWFVISTWFDLGANPGWAVFLFFILALIIILMEFFVNRLVLSNPEGWLLTLTPLTSLFYWIFRPFSWVMMSLIKLPQTTNRDIGTVTDAEIKTWVEGDQPGGGLEVGERQMIYSILHFGDTFCREIMVPRIDVVALEVNSSIPETTEAVLRSGHSRVPVYEESIDNVIGLLYAKDLLKIRLEENGSTPDIRDLLRPAYFVPEAKKVDELLREMQARGVHMAVVIDEYGGMAGLVTLEDIVEEIVGEIRDEYDQSEEMLFQQVSPDEYLFHGRINLDDFNEMLGTNLPTDTADTLGGFIYGNVGKVPTGGEVVEVDGWVLTVEQVSGRRIRFIRAVRKPSEMQEEEGSDVS